MPQFRKKPVVIEACQFLDFGSSYDLLHWANAIQYEHGRELVRWVNQHLLVPTLEGVMRAEIGDWIIKGVAGELYPIKDAIFRETYEAVSGDRLQESE